MSYGFILIVGHFRAIYLGFNEDLILEVTRDFKVMINRLLKRFIKFFRKLLICRNIAKNFSNKKNLQ
ncbi:hypothetical protein [Helicobacter cetorum]|uniref:hypothetical protein n=1 Tax=Helicobacter cetorum TaxID=138563 RepID=UPI000CF182B8|nr:hypothetical protein [Helicobacter cetorum]